MAGRYRGPMRAIGMASGLGLALGLSALLGALLGHYLDQRWGTGPWLTLAGTLGGTAVGFREVIVVLRRLGERGDGSTE
jgi:F0F1-type ATP synthase assembly protein I